MIDKHFIVFKNGVIVCRITKHENGSLSFDIFDIFKFFEYIFKTKLTSMFVITGLKLLNSFPSTNK